MIARLRSGWQNYQRRLTYLFVTACLLALLQAGHRTHWSLSFGGDKAQAAAPSVADSAVLQVAAPTPSRDAASPPTEIQLDADAVRKSAITVESAIVRPVREFVAANGVTAYDQDALAQLSVRVPGHVWKVEKRVGQEIAKGDCLAVIDAAAVGEAKTELLKAVVDEELKAKSLERLQLVAGEVAEKALRQAKAEAREAHLRTLSAQQKLINLGLPLRPDELRGLSDEELADRIRVLGLPEALLKSLDPHATTANLLPLTAPFAGTVIGRDAVIGEIVSPEKSQFVVADVSRMWILLEVFKEDASRVRRGQTVEFDVEGINQTVVGRIDWISTEMDEQTRTLQVRAEVANPVAPDGERLLKAHTFGQGRVVVREAATAVVVPPDAVHRDERGRFVFVRNGDRFVRRDVTIGVVDDEYCEILSGLAVAESVATAGSHVLKAELVTLAAE